MNPKTNPFAPGAGTQPPELAGRDQILQAGDIALDRVLHGLSAKSLILVGLRGVGKTVLLNRIWEKANTDGFKAILVEAAEDKPLPQLLVPHLRQVLYSLNAMENASDKARRGIRVLTSFINRFTTKVGEIEFGFETEIGSADSGDLEADLGELFVAVAEAAQDRKTAVAICIDELQYLSTIELRALIMAVHRINQRGLPFILVGAGLPQVIGLCGKSKSYAERLFDFPDVGQLTSPDARRALQSPVRNNDVDFDEDAVLEIIKETQGYPYFLQQWGHEAWNVAKCSPITLKDIKTATSLAVQNLDGSFFRVRFDRLTPRERDYLYALARLGSGSRRSGEIAESLGVRSQSVAPVRASLIKKGMIYSPQYGETMFTVPLFDTFLLRTMQGRAGSLPT